MQLKEIKKQFWHDVVIVRYKVERSSFVCLFLLWNSSCSLNVKRAPWSNNNAMSHFLIISIQMHNERYLYNNTNYKQLLKIGSTLVFNVQHSHPAWCVTNIALFHCFTPFWTHRSKVSRDFRALTKCHVGSRVSSICRSVSSRLRRIRGVGVLADCIATGGVYTAAAGIYCPSLWERSCVYCHDSREVLILFRNTDSDGADVFIWETGGLDPI